MTKGLIIGKFYPPHKGHSFLIETALSQVSELTLLLADHRDQKIRGTVREQWLREMHPTIDIRVIPDTLGPDDSEGWAKYTIALLGRAPDVVFTSEKYGDAYARYMGCRHVLVDFERARMPVSATRIRKDPFAYWDFLHPCVQAFFAKRVCVLGAESTGTTTLAKALAAHYRTAWVPEFGRTYWEGKLSGDGSSAWTTQEFVFIAQEQNRLEDQMARCCHRILICDTDSFVTGLWHERYLGSLSRDVEVLHETRGMDLYLLTDIDVPFVQDGTRDGEHIRTAMHHRLVEELEGRRKRYLLLSGSHEARMRKAISACDAVLSLPNPIAEG
jgi:HTH-type transcriptional repressor of NAD biosynthesis genes